MYERIKNYVEKYVSLTGAEWDSFFSLTSVSELKKKEFLFQEGDICKTENFVLKGCLKTFYVDRKGKEHVLDLAIEDWWLADLESFLNRTPARFSIQAIENSTLLQIELSALNDLYEQVPKFERFFRIIIQKSFIACRRRAISLNSQSAEERYLDYLQRYPDIERRVPQYLIASYLGLTPEMVSIIRRKRAKGL